ncbi:hypothetical protein ACKWTF_006449 [Chironomus riparius]
MLKNSAIVKNIKEKLLSFYLKINSRSFFKKTYFKSSSISSQEMFQEIWKFPMKTGKLIGLNFLNQDYVKFNYVHILTSLLYISSFFVSIYSAHKYHNNLVIFVFCLINLAGSIQGISKIFTFTFKQDSMCEIKEIAESFHESIQLEQEGTKIFEEMYIFAAVFSSFGFVMSLIAIISLPMYPLINYIIFNEVVLFFPIEIPYIDWKSSSFGYLLNFTYHFLLLAYFACASLLSNLFLIYSIIFAIAKYDIIKILLHKIDHLLKEDKQDSDKIHQNIKHLIEMQNQLSRFINLIQDTFSSYLFLEFATIMSEIVVSLFVMMNVSLNIRYRIRKWIRILNTFSNFRIVL